MASAYVQNNGNGTGSPVGITAASSGNMLVAFVCARRDAGARTVSSMSCTNVTWTKLAAATANGLSVEIWVGSVSGGSSGTSVTITMSGASATVITDFHEFSGCTIPTTFDGTAGTNTNAGSTSVTTGAWSALVADDLKIAAGGWGHGFMPSATPADFDATWTVGTGRNNASNNVVQAAWKVGSQATGAESAQWTISSGKWGSVLGGVKTPVVGGSTPSPSLMLIGVGS